MLRIIRVALWLCAVVCVTAATADAWMERWTGLFIAGIGACLALAAVWTARVLGRQLAQRDEQVHALGAGWAASEARCETLERDKRALAGLADWLSNGVTMPMHRLAATRPQPGLRIVRRRDR